VGGGGGQNQHQQHQRKTQKKERQKHGEKCIRAAAQHGTEAPLKKEATFKVVSFAKKRGYVVGVSVFLLLYHLLSLFFLMRAFCKSDGGGLAFSVEAFHPGCCVRVRMPMQTECSFPLCCWFCSILLSLPEFFFFRLS
jgi:hypothetical protein